MNRFKVTVAAAVAVALGGCATVVPLPDNVTLTAPDKNGQARFKVVDFQYQSPKPTPFAAVKLCAAQVVGNDEVILSGGSNVLFPTAYWREGSNTNTVGGDSIFVIVDEPSSIMVLKGITTRHWRGAVIVKNYIRYKLKITAKGSSGDMQFSSIEIAQADTGGITNDGFHKVGNWPGAHPIDVYKALKSIWYDLESCIKSS